MVVESEEGVGRSVEEGEESVEGGSGELGGEFEAARAVTCAVTVVRVAVAVIVDTDATTAGAVGRMLKVVKTGVDTPSALALCLAVAELTTR